jgi:hypothetical protein
VKQCQQFDVGFVLAYKVLDQAGAARDLSGITSSFLLLESPSGRRARYPATVDVPSSTVSYATQALDLDEWGQWRAQVELVGASEHTRGRVEDLWVAPNASAPELVLRPDPTVTTAGTRPAVLAGV